MFNALSTGGLVPSVHTVNGMKSVAEHLSQKQNLLKRREGEWCVEKFTDSCIAGSLSIILLCAYSM